MFHFLLQSQVRFTLTQSFCCCSSKLVGSKSQTRYACFSESVSRKIERRVVICHVDGAWPATAHSKSSWNSFVLLSDIWSPVCYISTKTQKHSDTTGRVFNRQAFRSTQRQLGSSDANFIKVHLQLVRVIKTWFDLARCHKIKPYITARRISTVIKCNYHIL